MYRDLSPFYFDWTRGNMIRLSQINSRQLDDYKCVIQSATGVIYEQNVEYRIMLLLQVVLFSDSHHLQPIHTHTHPHTHTHTPSHTHTLTQTPQCDLYMSVLVGYHGSECVCVSGGWDEWDDCH